MAFSFLLIQQRAVQSAVFFWLHMVDKISQTSSVTDNSADAALQEYIVVSVLPPVSDCQLESPGMLRENAKVGPNNCCAKKWQMNGLVFDQNCLVHGLDPKQSNLQDMAILKQ